MIEGAELIAGGNQNFTAQTVDQIQYGVIMPEGHEETADAFDKQAVAAAGNFANVQQCAVEFDRLTMTLRRGQWRKGFEEKERVNLFRGEFVLLQQAQQGNVATTAGAEWFNGQSACSAGAQPRE